MSIYGSHEEKLRQIMLDIVKIIKDLSQNNEEKYHEKLYEHLTYRLKSDESIREKCRRKNFEENTYNVIQEIHDAIGLRVVTSFVEDIYKIRDDISQINTIEIVKEKDYIKKAKDNGYRSYHMIIKYQGYFAEI